jgi:integrase
VRAEELSEIEAELPGYAKPIARIGFITGWRRGELLSRGWRHVDMGAGWLRLEPGETKNEEGRQFPLIPSLRAVLEEQYERKRAVERATGRIVASLFFYDDGRPIREFRFAWNAACRRAGHPGTLFHDLRRSAVRNLVRAGVPQPVAMQLTGHLTASVFRRYAIVDEQMLTEGAAKLSAFLAGARSERKVLPL